MTETPHEPETKGTNKTRDLQDVVIRARKAGYDDPLSVARYIHDWYMEASYEVQVSVLHYAVTHLWSTISSKMPGATVPQVRSRRKRVTHTVSADREAEIRKAARTEYNRKWLAWLDVILPMTGAQVRAAQSLPPEMTSKIADNQQVGQIFTATQLEPVYKKITL